ncbi:MULTISPECIES: hypothetical protein [unclassified Shewanella]|uniref:hypothetical protein n=1 Tax=unclassified Shewanella TaxID=196818 RepID=UPI001BBBD051|nr:MULTISPECIES: hypothetical protein [unclassified Shewanella]GIU15006.1 hypothetical protein TUM4444_25580 [Shewanella sp. MBTL60-112-B1]GIU39080.1 hypothetical protein TUM4445_34550 [Shewanella sp. MBTL60-112-B2]
MTKKTDAADLSFKALVKQHIESQTMSDEGLARIESLLVGVEQTEDKSLKKAEQDEAHQVKAAQAKNAGAESSAAQLSSNDFAAGEERNHNRPTRFKSMLALVASVLLLVFSLHWSPELSWQGGVSINQQSGVSDMSIKIAAEVAKNHIKMKPLEVQTAELSTLRDYFTALDFTPASSSRIGGGKQMIGGRYCSIQGLTAAQIRFADKQPLTLYQVQYDKALYGELPSVDLGQQPIELVDRGVAVSIWVEKGLLMATARSIE